MTLLREISATPILNVRKGSTELLGQKSKFLIGSVWWSISLDNRELKGQIVDQQYLSECIFLANLTRSLMSKSLFILHATRHAVSNFITIIFTTWHDLFGLRWKGVIFRGDEFLEDSRWITSLSFSFYPSLRHLFHIHFFFFLAFDLIINFEGIYLVRKTPDLGVILTV